MFFINCLKLRNMFFRSGFNIISNLRNRSFFTSIEKVNYYACIVSLTFLFSVA